jgi:hypothetical protein
MIYFLYGDPNKIFAKSNALIETLLKKNSEATFFKLDAYNFYDFNIDELIGGRSLFTGKQIIYLKRVFENGEISDSLIKKIKEISSSENIFIIAEEKLKKPIFNKIEKKSEKVQEFEIKKTTFKKEQNIFDMTNALGERDVKKLWSLYQEKIKTVRPEEIHGILWWQMKSILSASKSGNPNDSGLKPFVYQKATTYSKKYTQKELEEKSNELISMVHKYRRSGLDLSFALERFILSI